MSRRISREKAFKLIFEYLFIEEENEISFSNITADASDIEREFIRTLYNSAVQNSVRIAQLIEENSRDFNRDRIYKVDLAILYLAVAEILYADIPYQVSINEALEISKRYSTDKSPFFINGVLSGIVASTKNEENC